MRPNDERGVLNIPIEPVGFAEDEDAIGHWEDDGGAVAPPLQQNYFSDVTGTNRFDHPTAGGGRSTVL